MKTQKTAETNKQNSEICDNNVMWRIYCDDNIDLVIRHEKGEPIDMELEASEEVSLDYVRLANSTSGVDLVSEAFTRMDFIRKAISKWQENYSPISLKDDLVDVWYTADGNKEEDAVLVPWRVQQLGGRETTEFIEDYLSSLDRINVTDTGFTVTW